MATDTPYDTHRPADPSCAWALLARLLIAIGLAAKLAALAGLI